MQYHKLTPSFIISHFANDLMALSFAFKIRKSLLRFQSITQEIEKENQVFLAF